MDYDTVIVMLATTKADRNIGSIIAPVLNLSLFIADSMIQLTVIQLFSFDLGRIEVLHHVLVLTHRQSDHCSGLQHHGFLKVSHHDFSLDSYSSLIIARYPTHVCLLNIKAQLDSIDLSLSHKNSKVKICINGSDRIIIL